MIKHKRIFITGGAGFLGRSLVEKYYGDNEITIYSRDESKHYFLKKQYPNIKCIIGDIRNYDLLTGEKKELATAEVMYVMHHGFADSICYYSNPVEQGIDPIIIYGERGIYLVHERDNEEFTFFTNRKEAEKYANEAYDIWLEI